MKKTSETIFRCDFCNKPMFGKGAMSRHEKFCKSNPHNAHKCFEFCKHLKMTQEYEHDDYGNKTGGTEMLCIKRNVQMYSFKFEKNTRKPINALDGLERMPLECDLFECMNNWDNAITILPY
jgi:hypothetical protein